ncbi:hypothetical protein BsWGS_04860 [Bradybaena similaris]
MPSGRRPPPPPPPRDSDAVVPPPLPSRHPGNSKPVTDADDTYEEPACHPSSNNSMAPRLANLSLPADNYDCEDWSESEWIDSPDAETPGMFQSDDYVTPDGGIVPDDDNYNVPNETPPKIQKPILPRAAAPIPVSEKVNVSREDKNNNIGIKLLPDSRPKPPPNKPTTKEQPKPSVKPKPPKTSDSSLPKLPPRPGEKPLKTQDSKSNLNDNAKSGSVSSESNTHPQDTKKTAFQAKADKIDTLFGKKVVEAQQLAQEAPIYDDGVSETLPKYDWFHGELDRDEGAKRVKNLFENGAFLIRASKQDGTNNSHPYTLVVTLDHKVYNLKIRLRHDNRFAIGTYKSDEVSFATVPELVEHHKVNNIKLAEGGTVKLHLTPKK